MLVILVTENFCCVVDFVYCSTPILFVEGQEKCMGG